MQERLNGKSIVVIGLVTVLICLFALTYPAGSASIPSEVLSPVVGDLEIVSSLEKCSGTKWCFNQYQSGGHGPGGGICQADDTYAWDANLNTPEFDWDKGKPVYAVEQGVVSQTYGDCINAGGSYGQLLIEHKYQGNTWWSGYLHLRDIQVTPGQSVDKNTLLGYISNTSPEPISNHLHFVVYKGQNSRGKLVSFDANIVTRNFSPKFNPGDYVQTTADLHLRTDPEIDDNIITTIPSGSIGQVVDDKNNGIFADGYCWWHVQFGSDNGWCAEDWLEKTELPTTNPVFTIVGTVRNADDTLAADGLEVVISNETKGLTATTTLGEQESGKYGIAFVDTENKSVAVEGDSLMVTVKSEGDILGSQIYKLTSEDIVKALALVDVKLGFPTNQPQGVELNPTGLSRILWIFETPQEEWKNTKSMGEVGHEGDDYYADDWTKTDGNTRGQIAYAGISGKAIVLKPDPDGYGNHVVIYDESSNVALRYAHLDEVLVSDGQDVVAGSTPIGKVGSTGFSTGPHLHIVLYKNVSDPKGRPITIAHVPIGEPIDPPTEFAAPFLYNPRVTPVSTKLGDIINTRLLQRPIYPPYLLDPNSFSSAVTTIWLEFTDWFRRDDLTDNYDELYFTGIEYDSLRYEALIRARNFLESGDIANAEKYLKKADTYEKLSYISFQGASHVFEANLEAAETIARSIKDGCQTAVTFGLTFVNPTAAEAVDFIYDVIDLGIEYYLGDQEKAVKDFLVKQAIDTLFNNVQFEELGGKTIADWTENRAGKYLFPTLSKLTKSEKWQWALSKVIKEGVAGITEEKLIDITTSITDEATKTLNFLEAKLKSPGELRVYDSQERVAGLINGEVKCEIPSSVYDNGTIKIFFPTEVYRYEVAGTEEGTYGLEVTTVEDGKTTTFTATDIPTSLNAVHQYTVDWDVLSKGEEGVTVQMDSDGDGTFEETINTGATFTAEKEHPWDVNSDGIVDILDMVVVGQHFGESPPKESRADVNNDGKVDISDLLLVGSHFEEKARFTGR